jgi:uncharacterized protein (TIGR02246 family)
MTTTKYEQADEQAIAALVEVFVEGWNTGDGAACARPFAADADFTAVTGVQVRGRDLIARGHTEILATVFKGTRLRPAINRIRFIRPDVALAHVTLSFEIPPAGFDVKPTLLGIVATKDSEGWSIADFRNVMPFSRPLAGPLERQLMEAPVVKQ